MKTVLFMESTHAPVGGAATRLERLAALLPDRGWRPMFALTRGNRFHDPREYRRLHSGMESIDLDGRTGTPEGRREAVQRAILRVKPDIVDPGALSDAFEVMRMSKDEGREVRVVCGLVAVTPRGLAGLRHYEPIIDGAFGVSRYTMSLLERVCAIPADRLRLVPTGVPAPLGDARLQSASAIRLACAGRMDADKRPLDALALAADLERRGVDFHLTLVGDGELKAEVARLAERFVANGRVRILPKMSASELYQKVYPFCDVVLLFSPSEGFPNVLLEGMSHGAIPVTSAFDGLEEERFFIDGQNSLVFPVGNAAEAGAAVERLALDADLSRRLSAAARESVRFRSCAAMADGSVSLLDRLLDRSPRAGAVPPILETSGGRLARWLGPKWGERARRLARRRYPHRDASEWPLIDNCEWPELPAVEKMLAEDFPKRAAAAR